MERYIGRNSRVLEAKTLQYGMRELLVVVSVRTAVDDGKLRHYALERTTHGMNNGASSAIAFTGPLGEKDW